MERKPFPAVLAVVCWFALILQLWLSIRMSVNRHGDAIYGVWMYLAFFTVLTNIVVAVTVTLPLLAPRSWLGKFYAHANVITAVAAYIALVSITYNLLLRHVWTPRGWQLLADELLHDAIPVLFLIYWWIAVRRSVVTWNGIGRWALYPIGYFVYVMLRGAVTGFYPYPFVDVTRLGYGLVLLNACGLLAAFFAVAAALIAIVRATTRPAPAA